MLVVLLAGGLLFYFNGGEILQMGAEKSLLAVRSQVEEALPAGYRADKIMKEFDAALEKAKAGQINKGELKNFLFAMPAQLQDGKLDSTEADTLLQQFHKIVERSQQ